MSRGGGGGRGGSGHGRGSRTGRSHAKHGRDNRSRQLNPENRAFHRTRQGGKGGGWRDRMDKQAAGRIQSHSDRTGRNRAFKARAQSAADRKERGGD